MVFPQEGGLALQGKHVLTTLSCTPIQRDGFRRTDVGMMSLFVGNLDATITIPQTGALLSQKNGIKILTHLEHLARGVIRWFMRSMLLFL